MKLKRLLGSLVVACGIASGAAHATLFTTDFGALVPGYGPNDDTTFAAVSLPFTLNYFGTNYSSVNVSNNGNVQFGTNDGAYSPSPLNTSTVIRAIAPYWTDLDSRNDPLGAIAARTGGSGVYYRQISPTEVVFTWDRLGYYSQDYSSRVQFQLVLRDPNAGAGDIGFYYGEMGAQSGRNVTIGFGDGLAAINPGELSLFSGTTALAAGGGARDQTFNLDGGVITANVPEPASLALLTLGLAGLGFTRRRKT